MNLKEKDFKHVCEFTAILGFAPNIIEGNTAYWQGVNFHGCEDHLLSVSWKGAELEVRANPYAQPKAHTIKHLRHLLDGYCTYWNIDYSELDADELEKPETTERKVTKKEIEENIAEMLQQGHKPKDEEVRYWQDILDGWPNNAKYLVLKI